VLLVGLDNLLAYPFLVALRQIFVAPDLIKTFLETLADKCGLILSRTVGVDELGIVLLDLGLHRNHPLIFFGLRLVNERLHLLGGLVPLDLQLLRCLLLSDGLFEC